MAEGPARRGGPPPGPAPLRVLVVGGGITGLATAWYLRTGAGPVRPEVTLVEAGPRLGGKVRSECMGGVAVEAGPDTFLARVPWATDLARELGLGDDLVAPATGSAFVWQGGRLHPIPPGTVLGVPVTARALLRTGLLSPAGRARAALDLVLPRRPTGPDPSVADVIGGRLGREVLDHLVEPLVGGINAGRADALSLRSAARQLSMAAGTHRSLVLGLRAGRRPAGGGDGPPGPVFLAVRGGMQRLIDRLAASLDGVDVRLEAAAGPMVPADERADGDGGVATGRWRVPLGGGGDPDAVDADAGEADAVEADAVEADAVEADAVEADAVVLTVPAFAAAPVLAGVAPTAATELAAVRYASVVTATLAYRPEDVSRPLAGSGFLVPRGEGTLTTACTFTTSKWPATAAGGLVLLRASAGRAGDDRAIALDDAALVDRLHAELAAMVGLSAPPMEWRVHRWPRGFPQYEPGHEARVERIEAALPPGVFVAGAAYRGLGIAACVQQAEATAGRVMGLLSHAPTSGSRPRDPVPARET
ncbi:MAG: protoporphyrinogen oxidase [Acidimicrobiales bacterium]